MVKPADQERNDIRDAVYEAAMAWQDRERSSTSGCSMMLVAVHRDAWPAFLHVIEEAWEARRKEGR